MTRGTTPTHTFSNLPFALADCAEVWVTYGQGDNIVLEKTLEDLRQNSNGFSVTLTQEETLKFKDNAPVEIQIAYRRKDGFVARSAIILVNVRRVLHDGEI